VEEDYDFTKEISILNGLSENLKIFLKQSEESYIKTVQVNDKH